MSKQKQTVRYGRQQRQPQGLPVSQPIWSDINVINFCKRNHVMYIMRGVPGSGKSTIAESIQQLYPAGMVVICSADDYRYNSVGQYVWSKEKLHETHRLCESKAQEHCQNGTKVIIIDNTNILKRDMMKYLQLAHHYGYIICHIATTAQRIRVLIQRNIHNVPKDKIEKMINIFENIIPYYFAWKIGKKETKDVKQMVKKVLAACLSVPMFKHFIGKGRQVQIDHIFSLYHSRTFSSNASTSHVTTCYTNEGKIPDSHKYAFSHKISKSLGCVHQLNVIAWCITPRCLFARVLLNEEQKLFWGRDDSMNGEKSDLCVELQDDFGIACAFQRLGLGGMDNSSKIANFVQSIEEGCLIPDFGIGCTAHITIGVTGNRKPVIAKNDLKQIIWMELNEKPKKEWKLVPNLFRCYGDEFWVVYLEKPFTVSGMFCGVFQN